MLGETYKKVIIACFDVDSAKSVFYRGFQTAEKAMSKATELIEAGKVDYISVRIIGRQKIFPLSSFLTAETGPLNATHHTKEIDKNEGKEK